MTLKIIYCDYYNMTFMKERIIFMINVVKYPIFCGSDFIRLYCVMIFKYGFSPIIKHHELEKRLYEFYYLPEFKELFQDIFPKKDYINSENNYLDLENELQTAQLFGLLKLINAPGEIKSIIICNENIAQEVISNTDAKMVDKMTKLFDIMFELNDNEKKKIDNQILDGKTDVNIENNSKLVKTKLK